MNVRDFFKDKNWVVVGNVLNPDKYASKILKALRDEGFNAYGVHPNSETDTVYTSLKKVPYNIDIIDLCINPSLGIDIVKEAKELGITKILIQPGAESHEILDYCKKEGITAIEDCALIQLSMY